VSTVSEVTGDSDRGDGASRPGNAGDADTAPQAGYDYPPPAGGPPPEAAGRHGRRGRRRRAWLIALTAGVAAAAVIAAVVVIVIRPGRTVSQDGFVPAGATPAADARQVARVFLRAWESGRLRQAARYTDHRGAALPALESYRAGLHLRSLSFSVESAVATTAPRAAGAAGTPAPSASASPAGAAASTRLEKVTYQLRARVAASAGTAALAGTWVYHSSLVAYQQAGSPAWFVEWQPAVVAPNLTAAEHLAAVSVPPAVQEVTDDSGTPLASYGDPGLSHIATLLQQAGVPGQGAPGLDVQIETAAGQAVRDSQAVVVAPRNIADLVTTIQPQAEELARAAVRQKPQSSMVVIQPSTGKILAIANNDGFNDFALTAAVAPGSTMKIITTTALFSDGFATADTPVACPATYTVQGVTIHNDKGESEPASTPLYEDFAQSCNNAFTQWWPKLSAASASGPNKLAAAAREYYGLDQRWDIGIGGASAQYFSAPPAASGSELAEEDFGEGQLTASPLAMASIAATVDLGSFRQPILVPGAAQISATPLSASVDAQLKQEMRAVVTTGTAAGQGFGPDVFAKTGTADINGQEQPNSWFVAFEPDQDVAVAALDINAGYGAQFAAPEVRSFLSQYSG
jgi:Penicillin binding protein transpeptidase domain